MHTFEPMPATAIVMVGDVPVPVEIPALPPPPQVPLSLPSPAPVIQYLGAGEHAIWDDVWGWVSNTAKAAYGLAGAGLTAVVSEVLPLVEAYVGQELKALSGFLNDAYDFTATVGDNVLGFATAATTILYTDILSMANDIGNIRLDIAAIDYLEIPALLGAIGELAGSIDARILDGLANVESWAIDNIYHPLLADLEQLTHDVVVDIADTISGVESWARDQISAETLARIAAVAGLATAIAGITTWIEECGAPMCDTFGPKTDLGKFLKGLALVSDAALLAELANLDGAGIESLIRGLQSLAGGVIDDLDAVFTGGETIGSAIAAALG